MGYLDGFAVTIRQHRLFGGKQVTTEYSGGRSAKKRGRSSDPDVADDEKILLTALNKSDVAVFCQENGFPIPKTVVVNSKNDLAEVAIVSHNPGITDLNTPIPHRATSNPAVPPMAASTRLSASDRRSNSARPAPSAARMT